MAKDNTVSDTADSNNAEAKTEPNLITATKLYDNHVEDNSTNITNITNTNLEETYINSTIDHITNIEDNKRNTIVINISSKNEEELATIKDVIIELNDLIEDLYRKSLKNYISSF